MLGLPARSGSRVCRQGRAWEHDQVRRQTSRTSAAFHVTATPSTEQSVTLATRGIQDPKNQEHVTLDTYWFRWTIFAS